MNKKQNNCKGFEALLGVHVQALEDNSRSVVDILEEISHKNTPLSETEKNALKKIKGKLKTLDKKVDSLGVINGEEDDWFEF
mgnify:CR=1 FL=1